MRVIQSMDTRYERIDGQGMMLNSNDQQLADLKRHETGLL